MLLRDCDHVYTEAELGARLDHAATGRPLRVKLGMDPTAPDIHLGHAIVLRKMRQFQDLGHRAVLIIGDTTASIGDPTGRSKTRPVLSPEEIDRNAATYLAQAGRILDTSSEKLEIRRNSEWLGRMDLTDLLRLLGRMTLGQMLKREDFRTRYENETPIGLHELLYPLMQGWDSVCIEADVELGGTDQTYNNLVGRELQASVGQAPQVVLIMPLLRGLDGERKMSKSYGNYIGVAESARDMYGKTMSIPDGLLDEWYRLLTEVPEAEYQIAIAEHPMRAKAALARRIAGALHGEAEADAAAGWWHERFSQRQADAPVTVLIPEAERAGDFPAWKLVWLAHEREVTRSEARRMVSGGAFEYEGQKVTDPQQTLPLRAGAQFRAGRHRKGERVKQPFVGLVALEPEA